MDNNSDITTVGKLFLTWRVRETAPNYQPNKLPEIEEDFLIKVLNKKLKAMDIDVVFPDELLLILSISANNPVYIQLMAKDVLINAKKRNHYRLKHGYVISTKDVIKTWPKLFPIVDSYPQMKQKYDDAWEAQKETKGNRSYNLVDTYDWWANVRPGSKPSKK